MSYVSSVRRTVSSASKPSAFVGTSFSTGSSSLSQFSPSVSLFNREFTILSSSDLDSVTTTLLSTATTSSNVTPISPSVLRMFTRHDKGSSSSSLPDSLSSIFVSSFLNPAFWKHRKMHNCDTCRQEEYNNRIARRTFNDWSIFFSSHWNTRKLFLLGNKGIFFIKHNCT